MAVRTKRQGHLLLDRGVTWLPVDSPDFETFDPSSLWDPEVRLPGGYLGAYIGKSGYRLLLVGEALNTLRDTLPRQEWQFRCAMLGIYHEHATILVRAFVRMDFLLRHLPKPSAQALYDLGRIRSHKPWVGELLNTVASAWRRRRINSAGIRAAVKSQLQQAHCATFSGHRCEGQNHRSSQRCSLPTYPQQAEVPIER